MIIHSIFILYLIVRYMISFHLGIYIQMLDYKENDIFMNYHPINYY